MALYPCHCRFLKRHAYFLALIPERGWKSSNTTNNDELFASKSSFLKGKVLKVMSILVNTHCRQHYYDKEGDKIN